MKLIALLVFKHQGDNSKPLLLAKAEDLSSFGYFTRGTIREHLIFAARTIVQRTPAGRRQSVGLEDNPFLCHTYVKVDNLCGVCVSDQEYPQRVAYGLINQFLQDYAASNQGWATEQKEVAASPAFLTQQLATYQNPREADKILKIQNSLDEIKDIMHRNIDEVLRRGERLDDLMDKADDLSATSVHFYKQAKRTNQCCKAY